MVEEELHHAFSLRTEDSAGGTYICICVWTGKSSFRKRSRKFGLIGRSIWFRRIDSRQSRK